MRTLIASTFFDSLADLDPNDQARITGALMSNQLQAAFGRGDHTLAAHIKSLIENEDFANLGADEQTAVLSQVGNYQEIWDANLTPVGLVREGSANALWSDGGLMYAPPAR